MLGRLTWAILGEKIRGRYDYYKLPEQRQSWGGPFNGQHFRKEIFLELVDKIKFDCIIETGTYKGTTTEYMAQTVDVPVFTVEALERNYGFAYQRLRRFTNVVIKHSDSREFIKELASQVGIRQKTTLFYLDAHWQKDLPLEQELKLIFESWINSIILIDDFQVPDDEGYGFDDYGEGKALTLDYLKVHKRHNYRVFFPNVRSELEDGERRGLVVLSNSPVLIDNLQIMKTLREYQHRA